MDNRKYGDCTGTCSVCNINLWSTTGNKPVIWPCNIDKCPYEDPKEQNKRLSIETSSTGSGLAQILF